MKTQSNLYSKASGSIGKITASGSRVGVVLRKKPQHTQKQTVGQKRTTDLIRQANKNWKDALTPIAIANWRAYAKANPRENQTEHFVTQSPINAYCGAYAIIKPTYLNDDRMETNGPDNTQLLPAPNVRFVRNQANGILTMINIGINIGNYVTFISKPQRPTINKFRGTYRRMRAVFQVIDNRDIMQEYSPTNTGENVIVNVGDVIFTKVISISGFGRMSRYQYLRTEIENG